jgi:hypothetical protein
MGWDGVTDCRTSKNLTLDPLTTLGYPMHAHAFSSSSHSINRTAIVGGEHLLMHATHTSLVESCKHVG